MGIIDRLSDVIKSYLGEDSSKYERSGNMRGVDPDLEAAYKELNEFLGRGREKGAWSGAGFDGQFRTDGAQARPPAVPEELGSDFAELGVPFGADAETCKSAYKKLLKVHHPDRHAGHAENMRKATEKSMRINASYERIEKWRATGMV